jgi:ABC-type ATPase involved in cell division
MSSDQKNSNEDVSPILELVGVDTKSKSERAIRLQQFTGAILPGQLIHIHTGILDDSREVASLLLGLNQPVAGSIRFCGGNWQGTDYARHFEMRSRIGRVFAGSAWIQNLTIVENISLALLHRRVKLSRVKDQIDFWLNRVSGHHASTVRNSLRQRPAFVSEPILQICQIVRAFIVQPLFLLLESPLRFLPEELHDPLRNEIDAFNARGAATLWFDSQKLSGPSHLKGTMFRWSVVSHCLVTNESESW